MRRLPASILNVFRSIFLIATLTSHSSYAEISDLIVLGERVVDELTAWCPDAWCSGDFQHSFQNMTYNEENKWTLQFVSYLRFIDDNEGALIGVEDPNGVCSIKTKSIRAQYSTCEFSSPSPHDIVTYHPSFNSKLVISISDSFRNDLERCVRSIEDQFESK